MSRGGGPAFPGLATSEWHRGMSMRDYFAAAALTGFLADSAGCAQSGAKAGPEIVAAAYRAADLMLAERNKAAT